MPEPVSPTPDHVKVTSSAGADAVSVPFVGAVASRRIDAVAAVALALPFASFQNARTVFCPSPADNVKFAEAAAVTHVVQDVASVRHICFAVPDVTASVAVTVAALVVAAPPASLIVP